MRSEKKDLKGNQGDKRGREQTTIKMVCSRPRLFYMKIKRLRCYLTSSKDKLFLDVESRNLLCSDGTLVGNLNGVAFLVIVKA